MKTTELMIGDWVLAEYKVSDNRPAKVCGITSAGCIDLSFQNGMCLGTNTNHFIVPIPITPEILEKNGFENDFYEDVSVADYHSIRVEGYSLRGKVDGWDDFLIDYCNGKVDVVTDFHGEFRREIDCVHQLQHALRLCGIEKEIVL